MAETAKTLHLQVNGTGHDLSVDPHRTLLDILRSELGLKGPKYGCRHGPVRRLYGSGGRCPGAGLRHARGAGQRSRSYDIGGARGS